MSDHFPAFPPILEPRIMTSEHHQLQQERCYQWAQGELAAYGGDKMWQTYRRAVGAIDTLERMSLPTRTMVPFKQRADWLRFTRDMNALFERAPMCPLVLEVQADLMMFTAEIGDVVLRALSNPTKGMSAQDQHAGRQWIGTHLGVNSLESVLATYVLAVAAYRGAFVEIYTSVSDADEDDPRQASAGLLDQLATKLLAAVTRVVTSRLAQAMEAEDDILRFPAAASNCVLPELPRFPHVREGVLADGIHTAPYAAIAAMSGCFLNSSRSAVSIFSNTALLAMLIGEYPHARHALRIAGRHTQGNTPEEMRKIQELLNQLDPIANA
ncbi:hypothetical protein HY631_04265 [Candidatus Uhrbacteria bacterium]|nr:hypothetical protein [Candidatus Uhrbacteria bacterium]